MISDCLSIKKEKKTDGFRFKPRKIQSLLGLLDNLVELLSILPATFPQIYRHQSKDSEIITNLKKVAK